MRIFNAEPDGYSPEARAILERLGEVVEVECTRAQLLAEVLESDVLIVRLKHMIDTEVFAHAPLLRVIVSATTGLNHIDVAAAHARNIKVLSLKGEREFLDGITATAEHTWGLLLALIRRVPTAVQHVRNAGWNRDCFRGRQLSGLTLGIVGLGRLGAMVAEYGRAFRMRVVAYDILPVAHADHVEMVSLPDLLASSDVVCLLPSYQESSHQLLGPKEFGQIKAGAVLLNTSRGEVIDEAALLNALCCGQVAGAALDVLTGEGRRSSGWLSNHPLVEFARSSDRLLITPHIGGATNDSLREAEIFMARKLAEHLLGEG
jgi:D-3-phosphoglycerate dehydrogenase